MWNGVQKFQNPNVRVKLFQNLILLANHADERAWVSVAPSSIFAGMKFLIVGLGNAGAEYAHTRHNIGFDVVAAFVQKHGEQFKTDRLAYTASVRWKGRQ